MRRALVPDADSFHPTFWTLEQFVGALFWTLRGGSRGAPGNLFLMMLGAILVTTGSWSPVDRRRVLLWLGLALLATSSSIMMERDNLHFLSSSYYSVFLAVAVSLLWRKPFAWKAFTALFVVLVLTLSFRRSSIEQYNWLSPVSVTHLQAEWNYLYLESVAMPPARRAEAKAELGRLGLDNKDGGAILSRLVERRIDVWSRCDCAKRFRQNPGTAHLDFLRGGPRSRLSGAGLSMVSG